MSDLFFPIPSAQLADWIFTELDTRDSIFGIPRRHFFTPEAGDPFTTSAFGHRLETPFGPAAGPHSQMAQNIVAAWLCGARYIELKTVQTLDELDVSKPCIDMEDEGYNVEWSQELKVYQSFDEYLRAWVLIHALHHKLGFPGDAPGIVFNLSVGYNLEGIQKPNVQWFLEQMQDCSAYRQRIVDEVAVFYPEVREMEIPDRVSDNITLSTMHGCPPDEIERISAYLMQEQGLHTYVKCNPTLLGPERVRSMLRDMGYLDVTVPDIAFEHDLKYSDAVPMLQSLQAVGKQSGLHFGVKLSNTLEVENERTVFDQSEKMMYLSGRALHAITVNLADKLWREFDGALPMSFSAGADCFNAADLLACGMQTVTTCSDLLKTGGYLRFLQYIENTRDALAAQAGHERGNAGARLRQYAEQVVGQQRLQKSAFQTSRSKTERELGLFDCIEAPCVDRCAIDQDVPGYMRAVVTGDAQQAVRTTLSDNPVPCILGRVCDHLCEGACIRTHLDEPLAIREIKRFIMEQEVVEETAGPPGEDPRVAIIGAGPGGMAAALKLAEGGARVEVFEQHPYAGGMVGGAIPEYRLPDETFNRDLARLERLGVKVHYNVRAGRDVRLGELRAQGFEHIVIMAGAQLGKKLGLEGEDCSGVMDALYFLRHAREGRPVSTGKRIGIIGAGDTAMDCARTAWRLSDDANVSVIYRRTIDQMPADREEIVLLQQEGIGIEELAKPVRLLIEDGQLAGLVCRRMEYRGERDASGRKVPFEVPGSDFEIPLDTLILAISQHAVLDFFDGEPIKTNRWGYIVADPVTFETSVGGVYAGGDVVNDGPSSIVEAVADAKAIARTILGHADEPASRLDAREVGDLVLKRARRQWREPVPHTGLNARRNFDEVVLGFDEQQARTEASRCLDCDRYCSICVGVCPNLALQTWCMEPVQRQLPVLQAAPGDIRVTGHMPWRVAQGFQIAVLTDFCNECGNCTTFCPTAGEPYRDKPRLYLDRTEFEAQSDNAFMLFSQDGWAMEARWAGETHRIELNGELHYRTPRFAATLDADDFSVRHIEAAADMQKDETLSLEPCAVMYALLTGLKDSMPYLPAALPAEAASAGKIAHPGYTE